MKQLHSLRSGLAALLALLGPLTLSAQTYTYAVGDKITADDGVYVVAGENLITNGDFEDGLDGWYSGTGAALSESYFSIVEGGGPDGSDCLSADSGGGSSSAASIKTGWAVETGKTYVFSCWAYRTSSTNTAYSYVCQASSSTGTDERIGYINYDIGSWAQTEYVFTASYAYVSVNLGWLQSATQFDCFFLAELSLSDEISYTALEEAIAEAEEVYNSTEEGDEAQQYPADARAALLAAIAEAQSVLSSATSQTEVTAAAEALLEAIEEYEASVVMPFVVGQGYTITNVSAGLPLCSGGDGGTLQLATADPADSTQVFYFEVVPDGAEASGYNLRDAEYNYVYRSGTWNTYSSSSADLTAANSIFTVTYNGDYIQIVNAGSGSVLGPDNTTSGSLVYSNKNGTTALYSWTIERHTPTAVLEALISEAESLVSSTEVGTEYYQVPQTAVTALQAAIDEANAALETITTFDEGNAAATALQEAIDTFNASFNELPDFDTGETFTVTHYYGCVLTATESGNATITTLEDETAEETQLVIFESAASDTLSDTYYVCSVALDTYLARVGDYNTQWQADKDTTATLVQIVRLEGKWLGLKFIETDTYAGTDATASGSAIYSDKDGADNTYAYWFIDSYVTVVLDREAFNAAYAAAQDSLASMEVGYLTGQYFSSVVSEFSSVIASAKSSANKSKDQETLDAITAQLLEDIATYMAMAHTQDYLDYSSLGTALTKAANTLSSAAAGDANGQYPQEAIDAYQAAVDEAQALYDIAVEKVYVDEETTQAMLDEAVDSLVAAGETFAAAKVVVDYTALTAALSTANTTYSETADYVGDGAGSYPEETYAALAEQIEAATTLLSEKASSQSTVDAQTEALLEAVQALLDSYVPNDYSELEELLNQAAALIAQAEAGEIPYDEEYLEDLIASYEKCLALLDSSDQDEIDKGVKILTRDILIFSNHSTGVVSISGSAISFSFQDGQLSIVNLPADASVAVYSAGGQLVSRSAQSNLSAGVYLVRIVADGQSVAQKIYIK